MYKNIQFQMEFQAIVGELRESMKKFNKKEIRARNDSRAK